MQSIQVVGLDCHESLWPLQVLVRLEDSVFLSYSTVGTETIQYNITETCSELHALSEKENTMVGLQCFNALRDIRL
jgi:hypothetical protein